MFSSISASVGIIHGWFWNELNWCNKLKKIERIVIYGRTLVFMVLVSDMDELFGLIETAEKPLELSPYVCAQDINNFRCRFMALNRSVWSFQLAIGEKVSKRKAMIKKLYASISDQHAEYLRRREKLW